MKKRKKQGRRLMLAVCVLLCGTMAGILLQTPLRASAATTFVYPDSDMVGQGGFLYFIRQTAEGDNAVICRTQAAGGKTSVLVREPRGVSRLAADGAYLYYTSVDENENFVVRRCRLDGTDVCTLCKGSLCAVDNGQVYMLKTLADGRQRLFGMAVDENVGKKYAIKTTTTSELLDYVGIAGDTHYYQTYNVMTDRLILYRLNVQTRRLTRAAVEKRVALGSTCTLEVSAVAQVGSELYYDFGSYEGTGNHWYGTIKKLGADGKRKTVVRSTRDDQLMLGTKELYFSTSDGDSYSYQLSNGKKTGYSLEMQSGITYTIQGDKTYAIDLTNAKKITVSRFRSGTAREMLINNFISFAFKQKQNVSYRAALKPVGIYNLLCVTGTDYTDESYGWRGKVVSVNWYITDGAGTVLSSFR